MLGQRLNLGLTKNNMNILKTIQEKIRSNWKLAVKNKKPSLDHQQDQLATEWYRREVEQSKAEFKRFLSVK